MCFLYKAVELKVVENEPVTNLNSYLRDAIKESGIRNGLITVQSLHTTAGIFGQEDEEGIFAHDLPRLIDSLVPEGMYYRHDDLETRRPEVGPKEPKNARAHLAAFWPRILR